MAFDADFFDGKSSKKSAVQVTVYPGIIELTSAEVGRRQFAIKALVISPRIGKISKRVIRLPEDASIEFDGDELINAVLQQKPSHMGFHSIAYMMENSWRWIFITTVVCLGFVYSFFVFGIPSIARHVAYSMPVETDRSLGLGTLKTLDRVVFSPTSLSEQIQQRLRDRFAKMTAEVKGDFHFKLAFRRGGNIGPNAFALPSGIIVMTDEMVELSKNDDEIVAILAHEIGHVVHRHSLRTVIQNSATGIIIALFLGDASAVSSLAASLPTVLVHSKYSRDFESEADDYALVYLRSHQISPLVFANIMQRLVEKMGADMNNKTDFLSSHPATIKRIEKFKQAAQAG